MTRTLAASLLLSASSLTSAQPTPPAPAPVAITIDASITHQTIAGFGTCLISWDSRMAQWYRTPRAAEIFAEDLRLNILRVNLWGEGTIPETLDPSKISHTDPAFARTDPRTPVFIDFALAVQKLNPDLKVIGSVWSPPAWMKHNNRITDTASGAITGEDYIGDKDGKKVEFTNRIREDRYPHFIAWMTEFAKYYASRGVPLYALSPANEPQFTQTFESAVWTAKDLATITGLLGEHLASQNLSNILLFAPETMTGFNWDNGPNHKYTQAMRNDPLAWKHLDLFATHGYSDGITPDLSSNSSAKFFSIIKEYNRPYWMTEGGTGNHAWPAPAQDKGIALGIHNALVAGNASAFVPWQYAEDSTSEHNLMPLSGPNHKTHALRHFSRFIPPGSTRINATPPFPPAGSTPTTPGSPSASPAPIYPSAFLKDKTLTIILINTSPTPQPITLNLQNLPPEIQSLTPIQTTATSLSATLPPTPLTPLTQNQITLTLPGPSITTLTTLQP